MYIEKSREAKIMQTLDSVYTAVQGTLADEVAYEDFIDWTDDGIKRFNYRNNFKSSY